MAETNKKSISDIAKISIGIGVGFIAGYFISKSWSIWSLQSKTVKLEKYKRIITGHDAKGKAIVIQQDTIPNRKSPQNRNISVYNIWRCVNHKYANKDNDINTIDYCTQWGIIPLEPSINGSNFRIIEFRPESTIKNFYSTSSEKVEAAWSDFGVNNKNVFGGKNAPHPFMHKTESIDYAICLYGKIYMVLDDSDVLIETGDCVVQRGTNHSWKNSFDETCVMCFILIHSEE
eukprot:98069_1